MPIPARAQTRAEKSFIKSAQCNDNFSDKKAESGEVDSLQTGLLNASYIARLLGEKFN